MTSVQAIDFSRYLPPGVYTEAIPGPQLSVNSSAPTAVALFGTTVGFRTHVESILIDADTSITTPAINRTLAQKGIDTPTLAVVNPNTAQVFVENTDYTVVRVSVGPDATAGTHDDLYTISRVIDGGHIEVGDTVQISYSYTDPAYFDPYIFYDYDDVRQAYGEPFNTTTGMVQSELTLAAKFAFLNGAFQVLCVAVDAEIPGSPTTGEYEEALDKLVDQALVAIVVPCTGSQPLHAVVQQHVAAQSANRFERRAILGVDGVTVPVSSGQRIVNAQELTDQRIAMVSPDKFTYYSPELNNSIELGGQYMAASLAGQTISRSSAQPLTHKVLSGWREVPRQAEGEKNLETQNGLCVIEKTRRQLIRVRHGVTTDPTDLLHREWSIIGQQDAMVYRVRDYLENANLIGQPIYPYTLINVKSSAEAALQSLIRDGLLVDYMGLKVRQLLTNPDVIEVSYSWLPAFPLNYIVVRFGVSLTSGDITTQGNSSNTANFTSATSVTSAVGAPATSTSNNFGGVSNTLRSL